MVNSMNRTTQKGFTIVELLVVIVVISILAGVVIVGYGAWRKDIALSSVKSDLTAALSSMESARSFSKEGYPAALPNTFSSSQGVTVTYKSGSGKGFCVEGVSSALSGVVYHIDTAAGDKTPVEGTCPLGPEVTTPVSSFTNALGYGTAVDPATGDIYYSQGSPLTGGNIYRLSASGQSSSLYVSLGLSSIQDIAIYNGYLYAASSTSIGRVNLANKSVDTLPLTGSISEPRSLFFDEDTLYIGARRDLYKVDLPTGAVQSVYYSGANPYFVGIAKVDNKLYLTGLSYSIYTYDIASSTMTSVSRPTGTAKGSVVYLDNKLYTTIGADLNSYDIATNTWTIIRKVKHISCSAGGDMELYNGRLLYIGFTNMDDTTCVAPENGWSLYSIKP